MPYIYDKYVIIPMKIVKFIRYISLIYIAPPVLKIIYILLPLFIAPEVSPLILFLPAVMAIIFDYGIILWDDEKKY